MFKHNLNIGKAILRRRLEVFKRNLNTQNKVETTTWRRDQLSSNAVTMSLLSHTLVDDELILNLHQIIHARILIIGNLVLHLVHSYRRHLNH
jgi:ferredoxin-fold anticodon binding domain-containing protein